MFSGVAKKMHASFSPRWPPLQEFSEEASSFQVSLYLVYEECLKAQQMQSQNHHTRQWVSVFYHAIAESGSKQVAVCPSEDWDLIL